MKEEHALLALSHQRRLVAAAAALLTTMPGCGGAHRKPKDFSWQDHVEDMTEAEFKLRYRLDSHSFYKLLERLEPELQKDEKQQLRARSGTPVATAVRLAVALRYFAGGDVLDLKLIYCMSKTAVMTCIWEVVDAINLRMASLEFPIHDVTKLQELERAFSAGTRGGFWRPLLLHRFGGVGMLM